MASIPPQEREPRGRKRPWYLVVALVFISLAGVTAAADGCRIAGFYQGMPVEQPMPDGISDIDARLIHAAEEAFRAALDQDRRVVFPLAAAAIVLGMAMFAFSAAAMSGRDGARRALTQLVAVRAVVIAVGFVATRRFNEADDDLQRARTTAELRVSRGPRANQAIAEQEIFQQRWGRVVNIGFVATKMLAFGLVIVALTRRRTRQFYEATSEALADD